MVLLQNFRYLNYGEEKWLEQANKCLDQMNTYQDETRNGFKHVFGKQITALYLYIILYIIITKYLVYTHSVQRN